MAPGSAEKVFARKNKKSGKAVLAKQIRDNIEVKVLTNAGLLIENTLSTQQCVQTLGDCLADAVGLFMDFSDLPAQ